MVQLYCRDQQYTKGHAVLPAEAGRQGPLMLEPDEVPEETRLLGCLQRSRS